MLEAIFDFIADALGEKFASKFSRKRFILGFIFIIFLIALLIILFINFITY